MHYRIYGAGTPIDIESYSPEVAEAEVVERYGAKIENLVTVEQKDGIVLPGNCDS